MILVEDNNVIGTKTWVGTPMLLILEFFGRPFNRPNYTAMWKLRASLEGMPYVTAFDADGRVALVITGEQKDLEKMIHVLNRQKS